MSLCQREEEGEASPQLGVVVGPGLQALEVAGVVAERGGKPDPPPHFRLSSHAVLVWYITLLPASCMPYERAVLLY